MSESLADSLYQALSQVQSSENGAERPITNPRSLTGSSNVLENIDKSQYSSEFGTSQIQDRSSVFEETQEEVKPLSEGFPQKSNLYVPPHKRKGYVNQKEKINVPDLTSSSFASLSQIQSSKQPDQGISHPFPTDSSDLFSVKKDYIENKKEKIITDSKYVRKSEFSMKRDRVLKERTSTSYSENDRPNSKIENLENKYEWLENLKNKVPLEVVEIIGENLKQFESILKQSLKAEELILVFKVIAKLCTLEMNDTVVTCLSLACNQVFIDQVSNNVVQFMGNQKEITLEDLVNFLETVGKLFPTRMADGFQSIFMAGDMWMKFCEDYELIAIDPNLKCRFDDAKVLHKACFDKQISDKNKKKEKDKGKNMDVVPKENFRELSIFPEVEDILAEKPSFIRPNIINGSYESVEHYLDVQFRLLREDFLAPLREGISEYRNTSSKLLNKINNVRIYRKVKFLKPSIERHRIGLVVLFDPDNRMRNFDWKHSKWFMFGSLLLFSRNNFNTIMFATVIDRNDDMLQNGKIVVSLEGNLAVSNDLFRGEFVMAESEVFFEPYHHVLKALSEMIEYTFPMQKYIIHADSSNSAPRYINYSGRIVIDDFHFHVLDDESWPSHDELKLDESQYSALKSALTKEFVIIQGPPGTGKTFLGLKIADVLLQNSHLWNLKGCPLLVLCYTNHALDQFLEKLLPITEEIVRIGGQSKSEALEKFNLTTQRENHLRKLGTRQLYKLLNYKLNTLILKMSSLEDSLERLCSGIVSLSYLKRCGILGQNIQYFESQTEEEFVHWLMCGMYDHVPSHGEREEISNESEIQTAKNYYFDKHRLVYIEWGILQYEFREIKNKENLYDDDDNYFGIFVRHHRHFTNCRTCSSYSQKCYECRRHSYMREDLMSLRKNPNLWNMLEYLMESVMLPYSYPVTLALNIKVLEVIQKKVETKIKSIEMKSLKNPNFGDLLYFLHQKNNFLKLQIRYVRRHLRIQDVPEKEFIENLLQRNLQQLETQEKWTLYRYWVEQLRDQILNEFQHLKAEFETLTSMCEEVKQVNDLDILKDSRVVGMTTTGAARLQGLLKTLQPPIVIVEEAAEVMESHIVAALSESCEHLILIGDHKQLRPSPAVYKLARKYNFDVSLFERMFNNGISCDVLNLQHRMRQEISQLITPVIYPDLKNHPEVLKFEKVKGVLKSVFFLTHNQPEDELPDSSSHRNPYEADFLLAFCSYLISQGYMPSQITILATYAGQMFYLQNEQKKNGMLTDVKITVVDNFQGEENDIILLSLVRSNKEASIGFLSVENRVCVALSRAKIGLYIVGNMDNLIKSSDIWPKIKETLKKQEAIDTFLTLRCQVHASEFTIVRTAKDFTKVPNGCCSQICGTELNCGHKCVEVCHLSNREHENYTCQEPCVRTPGKCENNHKCKKLCWMECGDCPEIVTKTFQCGHTVNIACSDDRCTEAVDVEFPDCGHKVKKPCYLKLDEFECTEPCEDRVPCGHSCMLRCHKKNDPDHLEYICNKPCTAINKNCKESHQCRKLCYEECGDCDVHVKKNHPSCGHEISLLCSDDIDTYLCQVNCEKVLQCGHPCPRLCSDICGNCQVEVAKCVLECGHSVQVKCCEEPHRSLCKKNCSRTLKCGHICSKLCCEDCGDCQVEVTKTLPACQHTVVAKCCEIPYRIKCTNPCNRTLSCGHKCPNVCSQLCSIHCKELVASTVQSACGHFVEIPCFRQSQDDVDTKEVQSWCQEPCDSILLCGHPCGGTCKECNLQLFHKVCENKCDKILLCGHRCNRLCSELCLPCGKRCLNSCKHMKCSKECAVPCIRCKEPCDWACKHKQCSKLCYELCDREPCNEPCDKFLPCSHPCIGYCGEICPPFCRFCNEDEIIKVAGNKSICDSRFVYLEDCGHILEGNTLIQKREEIKLNVCPHCEVPIVKTQHFRNSAKFVFQNIFHIKYNLYKEMESVVMHCETLAHQLLQVNSELVGLEKDCEGYKATYDMLSNELRPESSTMDFNSLRIVVEMFLKLCRCFMGFKSLLDPGSKVKVFDQMNILLNSLGKVDRIAFHQTEEFRLELKRFHHLCQLLTIEREIINANCDMRNFYELACKIVFSNQRSSRNEFIKTEQMLKNIRKISSKCELKRSLEEFNEKVEKSSLHEIVPEILVNNILRTNVKLSGEIVKFQEAGEKTKPLTELSKEIIAVLNSFTVMIKKMNYIVTLKEKVRKYDLEMEVLTSQLTELKKRVRDLLPFNRLLEMRKILFMIEEKLGDDVDQELKSIQDIPEKASIGKSQYICFRSELEKFTLLENKLSDIEMMENVSIEMHSTLDALEKAFKEKCNTQNEITNLQFHLKSKSKPMAQISDCMTLTEDKLEQYLEYVEKLLKMFNKSVEGINIINLELNKLIKNVDEVLKNMIDLSKTRITRYLESRSRKFADQATGTLKAFIESETGKKIANLSELQRAEAYLKPKCDKAERETWNFSDINVLQEMKEKFSSLNNKKFESYIEEVLKLNKIAENVREIVNKSEDWKKEIVTAHETKIAALNNISSEWEALLSTVNVSFKTDYLNMPSSHWRQLINVMQEEKNICGYVKNVIQIKDCFQDHEFNYMKPSFEAEHWFVCPDNHIYYQRMNDTAHEAGSCDKCGK